MTKILVVDDEANLVELVKRYLEREGFALTTAVDGPSAVETARQLRPDVCEAARLDLDQQVAPDDVDDEPGHPDLESIPGSGVPLLQGSVERLLVQQADP